MTPRDLICLAINPALSLLPAKMDSTPAKAMILACCLQESGLQHRRQINGPARGFAQFEQIGVNGVQDHHTTAEYAAGVNGVLVYEPEQVYGALEHNDILAMAYARLLLWQFPGALPDGRMDVQMGWTQYLKLWRPGKPHPERWPNNYAMAWDAV